MQISALSSEVGSPRTGDKKKKLSDPLLSVQTKLSDPAKRGPPPTSHWLRLSRFEFPPPPGSSTFPGKKAHDRRKPVWQGCVLGLTSRERWDSGQDGEGKKKDYRSTQECPELQVLSAAICIACEAKMLSATSGPGVGARFIPDKTTNRLSRLSFFWKIGLLVK